METTQLSMSGGMEKGNEVYTHNSLLFGLKNWKNIIYNNMDEL